jgi:hypothetical protein
MDAVDAAHFVLKLEEYAEGTQMLEDLRNRINNTLFPVSFKPTDEMLKGIEAEITAQTDPKIYEMVVTALSERYTTSYKFNPRNQPPPPLLPFDKRLKMNLPMDFLRKNQFITTNADGSFNGDTVVEMKHGINYNLKEVVSVSTGKLIIRIAKIVLTVLFIIAATNFPSLLSRVA